ncbi:MAG TPA: hypothetical protein VKB80_01410 [Kofleriaceae bacterium]|nr:hypothetical protein [Kofleriaceae bacterium]
MDRRRPRSTSDEIDLYIRTYYSLLRSSGDVRVRAFEEAHIFSDSSLHAGAREPAPDVAAFAYSAARLPDCFPHVSRVVLGQSIEQFEQVGLPVRQFETVHARGRRRAMSWDGGDTLAVFITSASDIDDLVPIATAYQIEWNKMHALLGDAQAGAPGASSESGAAADAATADVATVAASAAAAADPDALLARIAVDGADAARLPGALGPEWRQALAMIAARECDLSIRLLDGSFSQYQTSAQRWWSGLERHYLALAEGASSGQHRRPIYFVSSNTHSIANLVGGYARAHQAELIEFARARDPEGLAAPLQRAQARGDEAAVNGYLYYLLRAYLNHGEPPPEVLAGVQAFDAESGIQSVPSPGRIDVSAQLVELARLRPERMDARVRIPGVERLAASDAVILNIDYPLGMAAYHHLSRVAQGVDEIRGIYVMGKAATLNGRVGDVMISNAVYDEHSRNTYLLRNCFSSGLLQPFMSEGTVLDNQKAVTVRSAYLQNRDYMGLFYADGYTVLEMEAGPYLSGVFEIISPGRHPNDEIVNLSTQVRFDLGVLHYASDTPYSRRQSLLSKSLSFFGVESTYACSVAILRRIFDQELLVSSMSPTYI